jgi:hypothetical protein
VKPDRTGLLVHVHIEHRRGGLEGVCGSRGDRRSEAHRRCSDDGAEPRARAEAAAGGYCSKADILGPIRSCAIARCADDVAGVVKLESLLLIGGIAHSDSAQWTDPRNSERGRPVAAGRATTPLTAGSGGHTTNFRTRESLEQPGYRSAIDLRERDRPSLGPRSRNSERH